MEEALTFALEHPDFARSRAWNPTKQKALERLIRAKRKAQAKQREAERRWKMSMEA